MSHMLPPATVSVMDGDSMQYLVAGGDEDIAAVVQVLARMPQEARGQVFIEVDNRLEIAVLPLPAGASLTWLVRDRHPCRGPVPEPGRMLVDAMAAWTAEWMPRPSGHRPDGLPITVWIGCIGNARVQQYCRNLASRFQEVRLRRPEAAP